MNLMLPKLGMGILNQPTHLARVAAEQTPDFGATLHLAVKMKRCGMIRTLYLQGMK
jgi:hypothetical protein